MNKSPAFQFYAADFLVGVMGMSDDEIGIYIKMLASQWEHGSLPSDAKSIKKLISSRKLPSENVLSKFPICDDGFRRNSRLENEREKQSSFRESRVNNANKRWGKGQDSNARASKVHSSSTSKTDALQSSSSSSSSSSERESKSARAPEEIHSDWTDRMPTAAARDFDGLQKKINELHPSWGKSPHLTRDEQQTLMSNSAPLFALEDSDWDNLKKFYAAHISEALGYFWRPDSRSKFISSINDVMTHCDNWMRKTK